MDFFSILSMVGGLALFLYGMNVMGDGLSKASGGRLERILEKLTSNLIKAVFVGAGVTAVIQSSSATTVMVVGFVNSGIMKLTQAIGVIMGANIGTTATSWILSLSGIESSNFFIRMLKPTSFSPILAIIGVGFLMFSKKEKLRDLGTIMLGFAVLMFGMDMMSQAVKPLADVPEFTSILTMFSNPILGMLAGTILTAVIQSSSASIGILQALCITGSVSYGTAIPIIMGQNIGTCVTALLSGIGANKNARRASLVHLYFNMIGTIIFMICFYGANLFLQFAFLNDAANAAGIAVMHSIFNITATIILLPFAKGLEKLAILSIPEEDTEEVSQEDKELGMLDIRFLDTPGFAIEQCKYVTVSMARMAEQALLQAISLIHRFDDKGVEEIINLENKVDKFEDELGTYLVKLSGRNLSERDSHTLSVLLHCMSDFERISDHALNIMESTRKMYKKDVAFSEKAMEEIQVFENAVKEILHMAIHVFEAEDLQQAQNIEPLEEVIDQMNSEIKKRHIKRLRKGKCTIDSGFILSDITTNFERIADHCSNVAVCLLQIHEDAFDTHEYLDMVKSSDNMEFRGKVMAYKEKYVLP